MIAKLLVFFIFFTLFALLKCQTSVPDLATSTPDVVSTVAPDFSPDCITETIDLELPSLGKIHEPLIIKISNPFGTVMAVGTIGTIISVRGSKTFAPTYPIIMHSDHHKNTYSLSFALSERPSSSQQNSVSVFSHICLLMLALFSQTRSPLIFAPALNYVAAPPPPPDDGQCPSVHLTILIPDQFVWTTRHLKHGVIVFELRRKPGKHFTMICEGPLKNTICTPWEFHNDPHKKCGGMIKGNCKKKNTTCVVSPYDPDINFQCLDETDRVSIIGGLHGTTFGYTVSASESTAHTYNIPAQHGERCHGAIEAMGNCASGLYCKGGKCVATTRRNGQEGYEVDDKEKWYCRYPVGSTTWVYYFSIEHWCTLQQNISTPGICPFATEDSTTYGGPDLMDGVTREAFIVNASVPGPHIYACVGDSVEVHVNSTNMSTGTSVHWHGMWNRFNQMADGVAQVTQCPIPPLHNWTYLYRAEPAGTTWYHSHTGLQYGDGLFGGITIFQNISQHWCSAVDNWYDKKVDGITWATWKNNWCNPYRKYYDSVLDALFIHDWFHLMSTQEFQASFFGVKYPEYYGKETPWCKFTYRGSGNFECVGGGPAGDMPWVSGLINGYGQYNGKACSVCEILINQTVPMESGPNCGTCKQGKNVDGSDNPCYTCGASLYHFIQPPKLGTTYRLSVVNTGQMYGLRFSIDKHTMRIIMADNMYSKPLDVQQFVVFPGQRIEFLLDIAQTATQNYWVRARTFPLQSWVFDTDTTSRWFGSFTPGEWRNEFGEILAVLQYSDKINGGMPPDNQKKFHETVSSEYSGVLHNVALIENKDISDVYCPGFFANYSAPTVQHYRLTSYFKYKAFPLNRTENLTVYVDGIMYPNFQLAFNLAEGIVNITGTGVPVVFARPHIPISISKGQWGLRNMTIFAGLEEFSPGQVLVGNYTTATYLKGNVPNVLYVANPGPMVHPLHLHGQTFALLASGRTNLTEALKISNHENEEFGCCIGSDNPIRVQHGGALLFDHWAEKWYDPEYSEYTDLIPETHPNSSLLIPGIGSRFVADPVVQDPYGAGGVTLDSPMLEDTLSVPPNGWALIQFVSSNPGSWFFHCHIEFHATGGMGFVYVTDPDSWDVVYPTGRQAQAGFMSYDNGVGADYACYDVEYLGSVQYW